MRKSYIYAQQTQKSHIINSSEAGEIRASAPPAAALPPQQALKLRGDMRMRYQLNDNENKQYSRHRGRYRLRLGFDAKINDRVSGAFGFASGSGADPRSTMLTFTDNHGKKNIYIDYAFAEYKASDTLSVTAGRSKNPLWLTNDLLWDGDINPEGLSARVTSALGGNWKFFGNAGYLVLNELSNDPQDPGLLFAQPGLSWKSAGGVYDFKAAAAVYAFSHLKHSAALAYRPSVAEGYQQANTLDAGNYKYGYDAFSPEFEINANIRNPVRLLGALGCKVSYLGVFGNYVRSLDHGSNNSGWIGGLKIGQRKVEAPGEWQLRYSLRRLEKDAWLDNYPDSDYYGGSTSVKGHEARLALGLTRGAGLEFDYYSAKPLSGNLKSERLLQADLNIKF